MISLLRRARKRKKKIQLLEQLFEKYWQPMYIRAFRFLKDQDQACTILQSIFLEVLNSDVLEKPTDWDHYLFDKLKIKLLESLLYQQVNEDTKFTLVDQHKQAEIYATR